MINRKLMACWGFIDFCLMGAGATCVAASVIWRAPNLMMNISVAPIALNAGLALGIILLVTFALSIAAIVQANHVTIGLVMLNWMLVIDSVLIVSIGSVIWFFTLHERDNFRAVWYALSDADRITIQDEFKCCGYENATDVAVVGGSFCSQTQVDFLNTVNWLADSNAQFFCISPITKFADYTLNNIFTTIYGFVSVTLTLLLATICVINLRKEEERFKKIDEKRGGRGFV